jgi:predicted P-loop ATPase
MNEIVINEPPITDTIQVGSMVSLIHSFLSDNHKLLHNSITNDIEDHKIKIDGQPKILDDRDINTIFLKLSNKLQKPPSKEFITNFINSNYVKSYNPFEFFFEKYKDYKRSESLISDLSKTINSDTPSVEKYIKHWGCGMIASIFGSQSELTLVLAGEAINMGKTQWFRRLLPDELKHYYDESSLDGGKDDDILMCKKLIVMDDEFGGKSKKDHKHFKGLTSRNKKAIRVPYGRTSIDMKRICSLCGTSNDLELLSDPFGNRRILPVNVISIDHDFYNSIDKISLMMAFYDLYKTGFHWKFIAADIAELDKGSDAFHDICFEAELIDAHFEIPENSDGEYMTATEIKCWLEIQSHQKMINLKKLGQELRNFGFSRKSKKINRLSSKVYFVKKKGQPAVNIPDQPF